jgi:2-keto-3-deoxy-L-fuconate dehydrogenase
MYERRSGKIVAVTSASPMRAIEGLAIYTPRAGERRTPSFSLWAPRRPTTNVQVNGIGPAFIENPSYFTPEML